MAYLTAGAEEYWVVDLRLHCVERWREGYVQPDVVTGTLKFGLAIGLEGEIDLVELFGRMVR